MARPPKAGLTDYELAVMRILWDESPLPVSRILGRLPRRPRPAYTSLATTVRTMQSKGYVSSRRQGKSDLFSATLRKDDYRRIAVRRLVAGLFDGDPIALATSLLEREGLDRRSLARLRALSRESV